MSQHVMITTAADGVGRTIAKAFAAEGHAETFHIK